MRRPSLLWSLALWLAVAATNRYADPADGAFFNDDSYHYLAMARAAPSLPQEKLTFHASQRLAIPYLLGMVNRVMPVEMHRLFQIAVVLTELAILLVLAGILKDLSVQRRQAHLVLAILALNPWAFRAYLTFPEMIADVGFVLGLAIMLRGLVKGGGATVFAGQLMASLSRQTGLLLVPMAVVWVWRDRKSWAGLIVPRRLALCLAMTVLAGGVYAATARVAAGFSDPNENGVHIYGIVTWLATEFDLLVLVQFLLRALAGAAIPVVFLLGIAHRWKNHAGYSGRVPTLLLGTVCIWAQPLLAGPAITGGNGPRLLAMGLLPLCLALAITLRDAGVFTDASSRRRSSWILVLLALSSMHHLYVIARIPSPGQRALFAMTYALAGAGIFLIARAEARALRRLGTGQLAEREELLEAAINRQAEVTTAEE